MCGIAGFLLAPGDRLDTARLTRMLHLGIDPRGGDATGAAWIDRSGATHHMTITGRAQDFRSSAPNAAHDARLAVLHTRLATQGTKHDQLNNHPIRSGHFLGVHNGHIYNDTELFAELPVPRMGEVDSEAAVALIRYASMKGEPVYTALERLEGRAALAWIDDRDPNTLHLARGSASPLEIAMTASGTVLFASTKGSLASAMKALNITAEWETTAPEGTYYRFHKGKLMEMQSFKPNPGTWSSKWTSVGTRDQGVDYNSEEWWADYLNGRNGGSDDRYSWANEPFVLGHRKGKAMAKARAAAKHRPAGGRLFVAARSGELVPYSDETYDEAWEHAGSRSTHSMTDAEYAREEELNLHDIETSRDLPDDLMWDDHDLYVAGVKALGWAGPASD